MMLSTHLFADSSSHNIVHHFSNLTFGQWISNEVHNAADSNHQFFTVCLPRAEANLKPPRRKKVKGSMGESLRILRSSPKILNLALLVVSYGVSHRLFEFAWKGQLRALYPSPQAYQGVLADVSIFTGYATITLMLAGKFVFQVRGHVFSMTSTVIQRC